MFLLFIYLFFERLHYDVPAQFDGTKEDSTFFLQNLSQQTDGSISGVLQNDRDADRPLAIRISALESGAFRLEVNEQSCIKHRFKPAHDVLVGEPPLASDARLDIEGPIARLTAKGRTLVLSINPLRFQADFFHGKERVLALNSR